MALVMDIAEVEAYLKVVFPQATDHENAAKLIDLYEMGARMCLPFDEDNIRPGGTLSGPAMMTLADYAMYACVLGHIGKQALAVTTNLNINFMRKPLPEDLYARCILQKLGRSLAVGVVNITNQDETKLYAHASLTYSRPPKEVSS